ncbi:unnamed protein product, partial [Meganyctiphanes norvegica]
MTQEEFRDFGGKATCSRDLSQQTTRISLIQTFLVMTKRSCPFADSYVPQTKIHVGERQIATGVMGKKKLEAVYAKTLGLLFSGAKNEQNNNIMELDRSDPMESGLCKDGSKGPKQMLLTSQGTLIKAQGICEVPVSPSVGCSSCSSGRIEKLKCGYCENRLCQICLKKCNFCFGEFCHKCSLTIY